MLRRFILLAALAVSGLFLAGAGTASAANCSFGFTPISYNGSWVWNATAQSCTNVNAVDFKLANTATAYIVDINHSGAVHFSYAGGGTAYSQFYPAAGAGQYFATYSNTIWGAGCPNSFPVYKVYQVRIHNTANGGSWGGWFNETSQQEAIC